MINSNISIIIVAGGSGTRMGHATPKQFLSLSGEPILLRTLKKFAASQPTAEIVIVLPAAHISHWQTILKKYECDIIHKIADGGDSRTQSVLSGLSKIENRSGVVLVHDGVRPLVTKELIYKIATLAVKYKAVIPAIAITDSIRKISDHGNHAVNRDLYKAIQTPQGFDIELIKQAYSASEGKEFTDDAAAIESLGVKIELIEGEKTNIKITTPEDMVIARSILKRDN